jgi:hypothetical protein
MSLCLISLPVPGIASSIQSIMLQMVYIDILQTNDWLIPFLESLNVDISRNPLEDETINMYFENSGFNSMYMFINLGSTFVYFNGAIALLVLHLALAMLAVLYDK